MPTDKGSSPYTLEPIRDPALFCGREALLDACWSNFERRTRFISVVGLPGSGKTSMLYRLKGPSAQRTKPSSDEGFLLIYLNCVQIQDPEAFVRHVFEEIVRLWPTCLMDGFDPPITRQDDLQYFLADMPRKPVLLLDNICGMTGNPAFTFEFFSYLRGIAVDIDIPMITTSCQRLADCVPQSIAASGFPNIFSATPLPPLKVRELEGMLKTLASRSAVDLMPYYDEIEALSGRVPFLVQMACSLYHQALSDGSHSLAAEQRASIADQFTKDARPYFRRIWKILPDRAKACAQELARGKGVTLSGSLTTQLRNVGFLQGERLFCEPFAEFAAQMESA